MGLVGAKQDTIFHLKQLLRPMMPYGHTMPQLVDTIKQDPSKPIEYEHEYNQYCHFCSCFE